MDNRLREEVLILHANICEGLADPTRILILYTLDEKPRNVTELAGVLDITQPTASRHLRMLRDRGMVVAERRAQAVVYSLTDRRVIEALDILRAVLADGLYSHGVLARSVVKELV